MLVIIVEGMSFVGGILLENWSSSIEMKRKSQIYREQKANIKAKFRAETNDIFDPDLGWAYRPNYRGSLYSNNSIGLRGTREYDLKAISNTLRIAAFGDSFVYGTEVGDHDTWTYHLETLLPSVEVLNFGIGGHGTDQAFLRYMTLGRQYAPGIVLIGFTAVSLRRNVNVYRRFISTSQIVHFKPRFELDEHGELVLVPLPVKSKEDYWKYYEHPELIVEQGKHDHSFKPFVYKNPFYDYSATLRLLSQAIEVMRSRLNDSKRLYRNGQFNRNSEAFKITLAILRRFNSEVKRDGATPIIMVFPGYEAVRKDPSKRVKVYQPLMDTLRDQNIEVVDLANAFNGRVKREEHFMPGRHYSPQSNRLIANFLARYLHARHLLNQSSETVF